MNISFILLQAATKIPSVSYWDVFMKGAIVSYTLIGLSLLLFYFFLERLWTFFKLTRENPKDLLDRIKQLLMTRGMESAQEALRKSSSSYSIILRESLEIMTYVKSDQLKERIDEVAQRELTKLERKVGYISLVAGAAPMVGFLGTVVGMIQAFSQLANQDGATSTQALAQGIYQAMGTTMGGLIVGLFAYIMYNYLIAKIHKVTGKMNTLIHDFILMLQQRS
ncbi:biopolymer transport protein [Bernardetia litoralis DSM 6794]|uniref:Biopolymer transport protein n=1 Tax=Bernardetia litoralis (strain ATCC 23117 / DSM 6794 / NBRC 15988 / NCIMB 1366 / Fx l1 / Sio-4) TaxID=880071 RepID=I4ANC9_BERLS|nr:MotA/TolQ/ExbB proton channel family protein [Bernardetia litoralis]AFM05464.1 biopolymer transport protein [Bernardetia litoralis DSM 6794]